MKTEAKQIEYAIEYINKSAFSEYTKKVLMELVREEESSNNPKGRVPRACPWGNENSPVGRQAKLVIKKCHGLCPWVSTEFFFFMLKLAIAERPLPERTKEALL